MSRAEAGPDRHSFWHDPALPFIEARAVQDGRHVCYDKHSHAHFSIGAITGGHSHYLNQRSLQEVGPGSLVLMNPEEVHACNPIADQPWSYLMFYLDTDWLRSQQEEAGLGSEFRPFDMTASRDPLLYQGLQHLHHQLVQGPDMPLVIMVTAHGRECLAQKQQEEQSQHLLNGFIVKPVTPSRLLDAVLDALAGKQMFSNAQQEAAPRQSRLNGLQLLLVEDNPTNQIVASELLGNEGALVEIAPGGTFALAMLDCHVKAISAQCEYLKLAPTPTDAAAKATENSSGWLGFPARYDTGLSWQYQLQK